MFFRECHSCGAYDERLFTDSWTGKELCLTCISEAKLVDNLTMSPYSEGDNLEELLERIDYRKSEL